MVHILSIRYSLFRIWILKIRYSGFMACGKTPVKRKRKALIISKA
jgi:hypothetical protein